MHLKHILLLLFVCYVTLTCTKRDGMRKERNRNRIRNRNRNRKQSMAEHDFSQPMDSTASVEEGCRLEVLCQSANGGVPISVPTEGPRGPPGKAGKPGKPGKDGEPGLPAVYDEPQKPKHPPVAFFVGLQANRGPILVNEDLIFDNIITNVGQAFNGETGRFTAPFNGTYQFTAVVAAQGRQRAAVDLVLNGRMVFTIWAESIPYWASATNSAILNLGAGDQVWLVLLSRAGYIHGYMYSTFSGSGLSADAH